MMRDPYSVLGVAKTADSAQIKSAYRRLAKKYHPDQSKEPKAKEKFAEANQAYEILGDEPKRAAFDRGEIDAEGKPRFRGFEGAGAGPSGGSPFDFGDFGAAGSPFSRGFRPGAGAGIDPSDLFADLLNGAGRGSRQQARARGEDVTANVLIPLEQVLSGGTARVTLPTGKTLDIKVPPGIEEGKNIRLKGQGNPASAGGEAGDAIVTVHFAPHKLFEIVGRDLRLDLPVTLYDAVLGGRLSVPTLDGTVEIALAAGANRGRTLRLRGKGLPSAAGAGDLLVTPKIVLPERTDAELEALMQRWRDDKPYDPRAAKA
jgi:DnaJ-class molecular chaperone